MPEIDKEQLAQIVGHDEDSEMLKKEVNIVKDKKQLSVRIPAKFAELAKIDPGIDSFEFKLFPLDESGKEFTVEAYLKKGKDDRTGI